MLFFRWTSLSGSPQLWRKVHTASGGFRVPGVVIPLQPCLMWHRKHPNLPEWDARTLDLVSLTATWRGYLTPVDRERERAHWRAHMRERGVGKGRREKRRGRQREISPSPWHYFDFFHLFFFNWHGVDITYNYPFLIEQHSGIWETHHVVQPSLPTRALATTGLPSVFIGLSILDVSYTQSQTASGLLCLASFT